MLALDSEFETGELPDAGQVPDATVPLLETPRPNKRRKLGTAPGRRLIPRGERLRRIADARRRDFELTKLSRVEIPSWLARTALLARFRAIDESSPHLELSRKIDEETVHVAEIWSEPPGGTGKERLLSRGLENLEEEVRILHRRFKLLRTQRVRKQLWVLQCMVTGDIPASWAAEISRSFFWELVETQSADRLLLPATLASVNDSRSRQSLDRLVREMRVEVTRLGELADATLNTRECLSLVLDLWNSPDTESVSSPKPWKTKGIPQSAQAPLLLALGRDTDLLRTALIQRFGEENLGSMVSFGGQESSLAKSLVETMIEGTVA